LFTHFINQINAWNMEHIKILIICLNQVSYQTGFSICV